MNLEYEAHFSTPLFELPLRNIQVLKALYQAVSPLGALRSSDMQVVGGTLLSEVRIGLNVLNGTGWLNLTTDILTIRFNRLLSSEHFAQCKACISLSEQAIKGVLPSFGLATSAPNGYEPR